MIELKSSPTDEILEFNVTGTVTDDDYKDVLIPALEEAIEAREHIRVLVRVDENFDHYTLEAMAQDTRVGLKHWRGFDRAAVVTDTGWLTRTVKAFSIFMPCPVATFALGQEDDARRWLRESLGSIHQIDLGNGILQVQLLGQLDASVYDEESEDLKAFLRANDRFRLLLDLREFDGWQGLAALGEHFNLVRDHHQLVDKVAIIGDKTWQAVGQRIMRQFVNAPVHYFPPEQFESAKAWLFADG